MKFIHNISKSLDKSTSKDTNINKKNNITNLLDFIYPPRCIACHELLLPFKEQFICPDCTEVLTPIPAPFCVCGRPKRECGTCGPHNFTQNTGAFFYSGICQDIIYKFKYAKKPFMAKGMAILMSQTIDKSVFENIDCIIPVPIHKNRMRKRGFNQAHLLAKHLSYLVFVPVAKNALIRTKDTKPLANFTPAHRQNTLANAFTADKKQLYDKRILLIDDIYTTGSTLNACAKVLYENGATAVSCATFSIVNNEKTK
ncbi:MAG: ComF family protein [Defluviitaleaceae bacterium]|nr:ComF family protein [Defluviitaleaceae bacterium]